MNTNLTGFSKTAGIKIFSIIIALIMTVSSCNQTEEDVAPIEDMPSLTETLEAFDEEVEYVEYAISGEENARWGYRRWKRKPTFFTLVAALNYTGLLKTVIKEKLTVFAPDDRAFRELGLNFWNIRHKIDKETLTAVLLNHVAGGFVFSSDLDCSFQTLGNTTLRVVEVDGGLVLQDDSEEATNFLFTDRRALRSVFHGIDKVLNLEMPAGTIADIAIGAANGDPAEFTQLVAALARTSGQEIDLLAAVLDPSANLTVFAPVDAAFFALYDALDGVEDIDDLPLDVVTRVLLHHVVGARVFSNCLSNGEVPTLNENITVSVDDLTITSSSDNVANLVVSDETLDIKALNGVIHVIDAVLIPSNYLEPLP